MEAAACRRPQPMQFRARLSAVSSGATWQHGRAQNSLPAGRANMLCPSRCICQRAASAQPKAGCAVAHKRQQGFSRRATQITRCLPYRQASLLYAAWLRWLMLRRTGHREDALLERAFWSSITLSPPYYGADTPCSFFDEHLRFGWNLRDLKCLLTQRDIPAIPGVTTPMTYFGMWKVGWSDMQTPASGNLQHSLAPGDATCWVAVEIASTVVLQSFFSWHIEDVDLYSINYLHFGAPKVSKPVAQYTDSLPAASLGAGIDSRAAGAPWILLAAVRGQPTSCNGNTMWALQMPAPHPLATACVQVWYSVSPADRARFENMAEQLYPELARNCKAFLRHKDILISPRVLRAFNVPFQQVCFRYRLQLQECAACESAVVDAIMEEAFPSNCLMRYHLTICRPARRQGSSSSSQPQRITPASTRCLPSASSICFVRGQVSMLQSSCDSACIQTLPQQTPLPASVHAETWCVPL